MKLFKNTTLRIAHLVIAALGIAATFSACKKTEDYYRVDDSRVKREEILYTQIPAPGSGENYSTLVILNYNKDTVKTKRVEATFLGNFQRWYINGQYRYTYFVKDPAMYLIPNVGYHAGYFVIADSGLNELKRVYLQPHGSITGDNNQRGLDLHDFILLADDHYIALSYYEKPVTNIPAFLKPANGIKVVAAIIQEVKGNDVVWQWDATTWPELYGNSVEGNNYADTTRVADYLHANSMFVDPNDGNLIVSCRNTDQVIKVSRKNGNIMWRLGGKNSDFHLPDNRKFLRQHHATLVDDNKTLLLFDNGDIALRPATRILEFQLNDVSKDVTGFRSFSVPGAFAQFMGSVQKIGGKYFIGGGTGNYIHEVDFTTNEKTFDLQLKTGPYRAFKYE